MAEGLKDTKEEVININQSCYCHLGPEAKFGQGCFIVFVPSEDGRSLPVGHTDS